MIATPPLLIVLLFRIKSKVKEFQVQQKFGGLFDEFKEEGIMIYSVILFYIRRIIALVGLVLFSEYVYVQTYMFTLSTLIVFVYTVIAMEFNALPI